MRSLIRLSFIVACAGVAGCNSLHIYKKEADTAATAAKADYEAAKIGDRIKAQRAILATLEDREVAAARKMTLAQRNQTLLAFASNSELSPVAATMAPKDKPQAPTTLNGFAATFLAEVDKRLELLDGEPEKRAGDQLLEVTWRKELSRAQQSQAAARNQVAFVHADFNSLPACDAKLAALDGASDERPLVALVKPDLAAKAKLFWPAMALYANKLGEGCASQLKAEEQLSKLKAEPNHMLSNALIEQKRHIDASKATAEAAKQAKIDLTFAADELARTSKALKANNTMESFTCPEVDKSKPVPEPKPGDPAENRLCNALAKLDSLGSVGDKIVSEEKIARIGRVLQALSGVTPAAEDGSVDSALALIAATTRLQHALNQYHGAGKWPALEPLIIEKQLAEAQLASANARVVLDNARLGYHADLVAALRLEIDLLGQARSTLFGGFGTADIIRRKETCGKDNGKRCASYEALLRSTAFENGVPAERQAYRAMALLSESYSTARDRQTTAQIRLALSGYKQALIRSEEGLASWKAVLDTPIDMLRQYHGGGLTPEFITQALQTVGIFGIARGVK